MVAREATDAARVGAKATQDTVAQMKDTAKRQLRAYMSRTGKPEFRELIQVDQSKIYEFAVPIVNSGQTPAYHVKALGMAMFYQRPLPSAADLTLASAPDSTSVAPVGPGEQLSVTCVSKPLSVEACLWMFSPDRDWALYLVGEVTYTDAFGDGHVLHFCEGVDWSFVHSVQYPTAHTFPVDCHNEAD